MVSGQTWESPAAHCRICMLSQKLVPRNPLKAGIEIQFGGRPDNTFSSWLFGAFPDGRIRDKRIRKLFFLTSRAKAFLFELLCIVHKSFLFFLCPDSLTWTKPCSKSVYTCCGKVFFSLRNVLFSLEIDELNLLYETYGGYIFISIFTRARPSKSMRKREINLSLHSWGSASDQRCKETFLAVFSSPAKLLKGEWKEEEEEASWDDLREKKREIRTSFCAADKARNFFTVKVFRREKFFSLSREKIEIIYLWKKRRGASFERKKRIYSLSIFVPCT